MVADLDESFGKLQSKFTVVEMFFSRSINGVGLSPPRLGSVDERKSEYTQYITQGWHAIRGFYALNMMMWLAASTLSESDRDARSVYSLQ